MLAQEGYDVVASRNKQHALALLHTDRFDLLLLGHSLTAKTKEEFAGLYRTQNPQGKILSLSRVEEPASSADHVLQAPIRPDELIRVIRRLLTAGA